MNASLNTWLRFRLPFASTLAAQESLLSRVTQTFISAGSVFGDVFLLLFLPLFYGSYNFGAREYWETLQWIPWILKSSFIHSLATNQLPLVVRINHPASWITAIKSPKCPGGSSSSNVLEPWLFFLVEEVLPWRLGWPNPQIKVMGKKQKL